MRTVTVRLPDKKHRRLKALAKSCGTPLNRLIDEMTTLMLAADVGDFDAETRFKLRAERGRGQAANAAAEQRIALVAVEAERRRIDAVAADGGAEHFVVVAALLVAG